MFCYFLSFRPGGLVSWRTYECIKAVWRRENIFTTHAQARKSEFRGSCVFMLIRWRWEQTGVASAGCERSQFSICGLHIKQQSSMTGQKDWVPLFGFNQVCRYQPHPLWQQNNMFAPIFYQNKMWNCFLVIPIIIFKKQSSCFLCSLSALKGCGWGLCGRYLCPVWNRLCQRRHFHIQDNCWPVHGKKQRTPERQRNLLLFKVFLCLMRSIFIWCQFLTPTGVHSHPWTCHFHGDEASQQGKNTCLTWKTCLLL